MARFTSPITGSARCQLAGRRSSPTGGGPSGPVWLISVNKDRKKSFTPWVAPLMV